MSTPTPVPANEGKLQRTALLSRRRLAVAATVFVFLYLLTPGPLSRAYQLGFDSKHLVFLSRVWLPLDWLCQIPAVKAFYAWYLPLWDIRNAHNPVEPAKLAALIKQADKIVVSDSPMKTAKVLFSSTAPDDIAEFNEALTIATPKGYFHCMCIGTPAVRLYRGETELALITNHHGRSVRCSLWTSDALISDAEKWLQWFDARKMPEPRKEVDDMTARAKQGEISYARWLAAMPKSVRPHWTRATRDELSPNIKPLRTALSKEFPDPRGRILALFSWYGSGDGPWSGFPSYEAIAEELLLEIPTPALVSAAQTDHLSDAQLEGAARLFGGWDFSQRRPDDRKILPPALKQKLLDHSLKSTDDDKLGRAKNAFAQ